MAGGNREHVGFESLEGNPGCFQITQERLQLVADPGKFHAMDQWHCYPIRGGGMLLDADAVLDHGNIPGTRMVDPREIPVSFRKNTSDGVVGFGGERMSVKFHQILQSVATAAGGHGAARQPPAQGSMEGAACQNQQIPGNMGFHAVKLLELGGQDL